jgi:hypothetical protein
MREIEVTPKNSSEAGGCNACTDNTLSGRQYPVWEISLRGCSLRVCFKCLMELRGKLYSVISG